MAWNRAYRALEHGTARGRFRHARRRFRYTGHMESFPRAVGEFANTFNRLQGERQAADYNPSPTFTPLRHPPDNRQRQAGNHQVRQSIP